MTIPPLLPQYSTDSSNRLILGEMNSPNYLLCIRLLNEAIDGNTLDCCVELYNQNGGRFTFITKDVKSALWRLSQLLKALFFSPCLLFGGSSANWVKERWNWALSGKESHIFHSSNLVCSRSYCHEILMSKDTWNHRKIIDECKKTFPNIAESRIRTLWTILHWMSTDMGWLENPRNPKRGHYVSLETIKTLPRPEEFVGKTGG